MQMTPTVHHPSKSGTRDGFSMQCMQPRGPKIFIKGKKPPASHNLLSSQLCITTLAKLLVTSFSVHKRYVGPEVSLFNHSSFVDDYCDCPR